MISERAREREREREREKENERAKEEQEEQESINKSVGQSVNQSVCQPSVISLTRCRAVRFHNHLIGAILVHLMESKMGVSCETFVKKWDPRETCTIIEREARSRG